MDPEQIPLRDLHLPPAPGWWPLAPGWWVLAGLAVLLLAWFAWQHYLSWRANRARRIALAELVWVQKSYEQKEDPIALAKDLSELLRRGLLAYAPRKMVAGLTGDAWLSWLDRGLEQPVFTSGAGRLIGTLPYLDRAAANTGDDIPALVDAVRLRLKTPLPEEAA